MSWPPPAVGTTCRGNGFVITAVKLRVCQPSRRETVNMPGQWPYLHAGYRPVRPVDAASPTPRRPIRPSNGRDQPPSTPERPRHARPPRARSPRRAADGRRVRGRCSRGTRAWCASRRVRARDGRPAAESRRAGVGEAIAGEVLEGLGRPRSHCERRSLWSVSPDWL